MAFVQTMSPEEEEKKNQGLLAPELSASGGEISGTAAPSMPSPEAKGAAGFTDINAYLDANREQAAGMGDVVAGRIGQEAQGFKGDVDTAFQGFGATVDQARNRTDTGLVNEAINNTATVAADPTKSAAFKRMLTGAYEGPTEFDREKLGGFTQRATELKAKAPDVTGKEGTKAYLYGSGVNPTLGQVELDSLLLGQDPTARGKIEHAAGQFKTLQDYLDQANTGAGQAVTSAQEEASRSKVEAERLGSHGREYRSGLDRKAAEKTSERDRIDRLRGQIPGLFEAIKAPGQGNLNQEYQQMLDSFVTKDRQDELERSAELNIATTPQTNPYLPDRSAWRASDFFTPGRTGTQGSATAWTASNQDDLAKMRAIESLMDQEYGFEGNQDQLGSFDVGQIANINTSPRQDLGRDEFLGSIRSATTPEQWMKNNEALLAKLEALGFDTSPALIGQTGQIHPGASAQKLLDQYNQYRYQFWQ